MQRCPRLCPDVLGVCLTTQPFQTERLALSFSIFIRPFPDYDEIFMGFQKLQQSQGQDTLGNVRGASNINVMDAPGDQRPSRLIIFKNYVTSLISLHNLEQNLKNVDEGRCYIK